MSFVFKSQILHLLPPQGKISLECPLRFFIIARCRSWSKQGCRWPERPRSLASDLGMHPTLALSTDLLNPHLSPALRAHWSVLSPSLHRMLMTVSWQDRNHQIAKLCLSGLENTPPSPADTSDSPQPPATLSLRTRPPFCSFILNHCNTTDNTGHHFQSLEASQRAC